MSVKPHLRAALELNCVALQYRRLDRIREGVSISLLGCLSDRELRVKPFDLGVDRQQHLQLGLGGLRQGVSVVVNVVDFDYWYFFSFACTYNTTVL